MIVSGATLSCLIFHKSSNACLHCMPFLQALIAALKVTVFDLSSAGPTPGWFKAFGHPGLTMSCHISRKNLNVRFHCMHFSKALIASLKVIVFGAYLSCHVFAQELQRTLPFATWARKR